MTTVWKNLSLKFESKMYFYLDQVKTVAMNKYYYLHCKLKYSILLNKKKFINTPVKKKK